MTSQFRKKPVVIEAFQLTKEMAIRNLIDKETLPFGLHIQDASFHEERREVYRFRLFIKTLEGQLAAIENDWVIRGTKGELYPCKPDIFADIYEPA